VLQQMSAVHAVDVLFKTGVALSWVYGAYHSRRYFQLLGKAQTEGTIPAGFAKSAHGIGMDDRQSRSRARRRYSPAEVHVWSSRLHYPLCRLSPVFDNYSALAIHPRGKCWAAWRAGPPPKLNGPLMLPLELRERANGFFQSLR
jgi:hypothetical protein